MDINEAEMVLVGIGDAFEENENAIEAYNALAKKLSGKNYFVISLCMDDKIYESDLKEDRIVTPLGGKRQKQCPDACTKDLFEPDEAVCPRCGKELVFNNILCENYVEEGYLPQWEKHKLWLTGTLNKKLLLLELGVSMKFPQIIRWPFERLAMLNNKAHLIRVNDKLYQIPEELGTGKGTAIKDDPVKWAGLL